MSADCAGTLSASQPPLNHSMWTNIANQNAGRCDASVLNKMAILRKLQMALCQTFHMQDITSYLFFCAARYGSQEWMFVSSIISKISQRELWIVLMSLGKNGQNSSGMSIYISVCWRLQIPLQFRTDQTASKSAVAHGNWLWNWEIKLHGRIVREFLDV